MNLLVNKVSKLTGTINIPSSKSHTIRAVVIASMASDVSILRNPLDSFDTKAAINACAKLGAKIEQNDNEWKIYGTGGKIYKPNDTLDLMNSGTSLNLVTGIGALGDFELILDGDSSLRSRPMQSLINALNNLGVEADSLDNNGKPPIKIKGPIKGGKTTINGINSQYLSSLLIATPLAKNNTEIIVENLHEIPYVLITLKWLDEQEIKYDKADDLSWFKIYGSQKYKAFNKELPSDWSSALFPICAGLITDSEICINGPDINDVQGDKEIINVLKSMGANIEIGNKFLRVKKSKLKGRVIDLNSMPDALPAMSIIGCIADGETIIDNVCQARIKETDRIKVMCEELKKMGADIKEFSDGLKIKKSELKASKLNGYNDHRVIMALSLAGMTCLGETSINTAESIGVTFPNYIEEMNKIGANLRLA